MSLGNVLAVAYATQREKLTFLEEEDKVGTGSPRAGAGPGLTSADAGRRTGQCRGEERTRLRAWLCCFPACDLWPCVFGACFPSWQTVEAAPSSRVAARMGWALQCPA